MITKAAILRWFQMAGATLALCAADIGATSLRQNPEVERLIDELVAEHRFDRAQLRGWFAKATVQTSILKAVAQPGTSRPWHVYRASQVNTARIRGGLDYWHRHAEALARASSEYGVPEEIIVATIGIETAYGRSVGSHNVFDALVTLAFAHPPRAELFRSELVQYLLLSREMGFDPLRPKGSYAGAMGVPQFLPSSYRRHAVDFDNDARRDLWNHGDAIGSVANYYRAYGWRTGESAVIGLEQVGERSVDGVKEALALGLKPQLSVATVRKLGLNPVDTINDDALASLIEVETEAGMRYLAALENFYVITRYNRSINYALAVHDLALELRRARRAVGAN